MGEMKEREGTMWREAKGRGTIYIWHPKSLISNQVGISSVEVLYLCDNKPCDDKICLPSL
jgi:hypothetical protein